MPLASMVPEDVERELRSVAGGAYDGLDELARVILMLAHRFDTIGNEDVQPYRAEHPRDIGQCLSRLVTAGSLVKTGHGRGTRYRLAREQSGAAALHQGASSTHNEASSTHNGGSSTHNEGSSTHNEASSTHNEGSSPLTLPDDDLQLMELARKVRERLRAPTAEIRETILALCARRSFATEELAALVARTPAGLQERYIRPLVREGLLVPLYPEQPSHPQQRYRSSVPVQRD